MKTRYILLLLLLAAGIAFPKNVMIVATTPNTGFETAELCAAATGITDAFNYTALEYMVNISADGDTVYLCPGEHVLSGQRYYIITNMYAMNVSLFLNSSVNIRGLTDYGQVNLSHSDNTMSLIFASAAARNTNISGITFTGMGSTLTDVAVISNASHLSLSYNVFDGGSYGVLLIDNPDETVYNITLSYNNISALIGISGLYTSGTYRDAFIYRNTFDSGWPSVTYAAYNDYLDCITTSVIFTGISVIQGNTLSRCHLGIKPGSGAYVYDNTISDSAIGLSADQTIHTKNNTFTNINLTAILVNNTGDTMTFDDVKITTANMEAHPQHAAIVVNNVTQAYFSNVSITSTSEAMTYGVLSQVANVSLFGANITSSAPLTAYKAVDSNLVFDITGSVNVLKSLVGFDFVLSNSNATAKSNFTASSLVMNFSLTDVSMKAYTTANITAAAPANVTINESVVGGVLNMTNTSAHGNMSALTIYFESVGITDSDVIAGMRIAKNNQNGSGWMPLSATVNTSYKTVTLTGWVDTFSYFAPFESVQASTPTPETTTTIAAPSPGHSVSVPVSETMEMSGTSEEVTMNMNDRVQFSVSGASGSESHTVTLVSISGTTVRFKVQSAVQYVDVQKGTPKDVDVNGDGTVDLRLEVISISGISANVKITVASTGVSTTTTQTAAPDAGNVSSEQVPQADASKNEAEFALSGAASAIQNAKNAGKDTTDAEAKYAQAQTAFRQGQFATAKTLADSAKALALSAKVPATQQTQTPAEKPPAAQTEQPASSEQPAATAEPPPAAPQQGGLGWLPLVVVALILVGGIYWFFVRKK
ncbi:MAG: hypothetical protein ACP5NX_03515 [Candidatus Bilamarchaeaceae archaeon]